MAPDDGKIDDVTTEPNPEQSVYEAVGGSAVFEIITEVFYQHVAADEVLSHMYPEEDLGPAQQRLQLFLEQYFGGPTTYSQRRGHPRLRARHVPYQVDDDARRRWLAAFRAGLDAAALSPEHDALIWDYAQRAAQFMVNTPG